MGWSMGALKSFAAGLVFTLLLVVVVPIVIDRYVMGYITEIVGDTGFFFITSDILVTILVYAVILLIMLVLGAGGILKKFGVFGLAGLVFAYWLLGDVRDALLPLLVLSAMLLVSWIYRKKKEQRNASKQMDAKNN